MQKKKCSTVILKFESNNQTSATALLNSLLYIVQGPQHTDLYLSRAASFCCCCYHRYREMSCDRGKVKNNCYLFIYMPKHLTVFFYTLNGRKNLSLLFHSSFRICNLFIFVTYRLFFSNCNPFMAGTNHTKLSKYEVHFKH